MILDSSAIVAVLFREDGHEGLLQAIVAADRLGVGAPTLTETAIVLTARLDLRGRSLLARFVDEAEIEIEPFVSEHWQVASEAFSRYGKGRHPAALNFGDCLTYASAALAQRPLLCIGGDFSQTDLVLAPIRPR